MEEANVEHNSLTKQLLVRRHLQHREMEAALAILSENTQPTAEGVDSKENYTYLSRTPLQTIVAVVSLANEIGETHLAQNIIEHHHKRSARILPEYVYIDLAMASMGDGDVSKLFPRSNRV